MRNYFPKRTSGAPLHTLSKLYDIPVGFETPALLRQCIAIFAVAEWWLLLDIGWFVLFLPLNDTSKLENWHSQRGPRWKHVTMTLTFDLLTPKSISVFLSLSSICVWGMKSLGQTLFELLRYNEVVNRRTDGQTEGRTDRRTDKVIIIGLPHLRWRGPNNHIILKKEDTFVPIFQ